MSTSVRVNLGPVGVHTARGDFNPSVQVTLSQDIVSKREDIEPFSIPANVQQYLQSIIENLSTQADQAPFNQLTAEIAAGRNIEIIPGHGIRTFVGNPASRMPSLSDHTYKVSDIAAYKRAYTAPRFVLISILDKALPTPASTTPDPTPKKNWFDHAQTTALPIPYPVYDPHASKWNKASAKWSQISYSVFKKSDDLSITIDSKISKYTGGFSLVIRATILALGIIGYGLSWALGHLTYVPVRALLSNPYTPIIDEINIGRVTFYMNGEPRHFDNVGINYRSVNEPTQAQKDAIKEHYRHYHQALINEINMHPDEATRTRFQAVFQPGNTPIVIPNHGIRFQDEAVPFYVPDRIAFITKYDTELATRYQAITRSFEEPPVPVEPPNWFDDALNQPIPIPRPDDAAVGAGALIETSTKCAQAAHTVFKTFDDWAIAFDNATGKYLGAVSLIGRGVLDLTGLVIGYGVVFGLGHLTYVPIAAAIKKFRP